MGRAASGNIIKIKGDVGQPIAVATLTGTQVTYEGLNGKITLTGDTTVIMPDTLQAGQSGNFTITNPAAAHTMEFMGYEFKISSDLTPTGAKITMSGNNKLDFLRWYYDGQFLFIDGEMAYADSGIPDPEPDPDPGPEPDPDPSTYLGTVYYVSSSGDDSNTGTNENEPLKTITKVNTLTLSPGDAVLFKRGDSFEGTITVGQSGLVNEPITFGAYGTGARPKIYGSEVVTGWTLHSGNIYKATVSSAVQQVFLDGEKMLAARYPNESVGFPADGYFFMDSNGSTTEFTDSELNGSINYAGAKAFIRTNYWTTQLIDVASSSSQTIVLNEAPRFALKAGLGYFLMNKLDFLTQAGEWFYDSSANLLYLWTPTGATPANFTVRASTTANGIAISAKNYVDVRSLNILQQTDIGISTTGTCTYLTIHNNFVENQDAIGINVEDQSSYLTVTDNTVTGQNQFGMMLRASYCDVIDNTISDVAMFSQLGLIGNGGDNEGVGLYVVGADGNNTIRYNTIENIGYNGLAFYKEDNLIEYNFINNVCTIKNDGGGIYSSWYNRVSETGPAGTIIRYNIILNSVGEIYGYTSLKAFGEGIYIDESSEGVIIRNNIIAYNRASGIKLHKNENALIEYNTLYGNHQSIRDLNSSGTVKNNVLNNIMIAEDESWTTDDFPTNQAFNYFSSGNTDYDYNTYYHPFRTDKLFWTAWNVNYDFSGWQTYIGGEANSAFSNPTLAAGETMELFYNKTKVAKTYTVTGTNVRNISGTSVSEFTLQPFTSIVLMGTSIVVSDGTEVPDEPTPEVVDVLTNAVSVWDFDGDVTDSHGTNNGTANSVTSVAGKLGTAYAYNPLIPSSVNVPHVSALTANQFSVSIWFYPTDTSSLRGLITGAGGNGYTYGWAIYYKSDDIIFRCGNGTSYVTHLSSNIGTVSINTWYNVIVTYSGTEVKLYVNGVLKNTTSNVSIGYHPTAPENYDMKFGLMSGESSHHGRIDQTRYNSEVWNQDQIDKIYNDGSGLTYAET